MFGNLFKKKTKVFIYDDKTVMKTHDLDFIHRVNAKLHLYDLTIRNILRKLFNDEVNNFKIFIEPNCGNSPVKDIVGRTSSVTYVGRDQVVLMTTAMIFEFEDEIEIIDRSSSTFKDCVQFAELRKVLDLVLGGSINIDVVATLFLRNTGELGIHEINVLDEYLRYNVSQISLLEELKKNIDFINDTHHISEKNVLWKNFNDSARLLFKDVENTLNRREHFTKTGKLNYDQPTKKES